MLECVKQAGQLFRRDARPGVNDLEAHEDSLGVFVQHAGTQRDHTGSGELDGVPRVVQQGLAQSCLIASEPGRQVVGVDLYGQCLGMSLLPDQAADLL